LFLKIKSNEISIDEFVKRIKQYVKERNFRQLIVDGHEFEGKYVYELKVDLVKNSKENISNMPSMAIFYCWIIQGAFANALNLDNECVDLIGPSNVHKCMEEKLRPRYKMKVLPPKILLIVSIVTIAVGIGLACLSGTIGLVGILSMLLGVALLIVAIVLLVKRKVYKKEITIYSSKNPHIPVFKGSKSFYDKSDTNNNSNNNSKTTNKKSDINSNSNNNSKPTNTNKSNNDTKNWTDEQWIDEFLMRILNIFQSNERNPNYQSDYYRVNCADWVDEFNNAIKESNGNAKEPLYWILKMLTKSKSETNSYILNANIIGYLYDAMMIMGLFRGSYRMLNYILFSFLTLEEEKKVYHPKDNYYFLVYLMSASMLTLLYYSGKKDLEGETVPYYKNGIAYVALGLSGAQKISYKDNDIHNISLCNEYFEQGAFSENLDNLDYFRKIKNYNPKAYEDAKKNVIKYRYNAKE